MAFTKTWLGTTGDYSLSTNWNLISLRTAAFAWTASGSGTNEYYVRTAANADPGFAATPPTSNGVYISGSAATKGTLGALTAGQWGYGDNDALGYSTVYVRLSAGGDPDAQSADHVQFRQIPQTAENVRIPAGAGSISSNLDQSAVAINGFYVEPGYEGTIGAATGYLRIDPDIFEFEGDGGVAYIDIGTAAIGPRIRNTVAPDPGGRGLYLRGTAMSVVDIQAGSVGIASLPGELSTATTVRIVGKADVWLGAGLTLTNFHQWAGEAILRGSVGTATILYGGTLWTQEAGTQVAVTQKGGKYLYGSSGNITTYNLYGGEFDEMQSGAARTIATLNTYAGSWTIKRNKEAVAHTAEVTNDSLNLSGSA